MAYSSWIPFEKYLDKYQKND